MQDSSTPKYAKGTRVGGHKNDQVRNFQTRGRANAPLVEDPAPTTSPPLTPPFSSGSLSQHDSELGDCLDEVNASASMKSNSPPPFNFARVPVETPPNSPTSEMEQSPPNSPVAEMDVEITALEHSPPHTTPADGDQSDVSSHSGSSRTSPTHSFEEKEHGDDMDLDDDNDTGTGDHHPPGGDHVPENDDSGVDTDHGSDIGAPDDVEWLEEDIEAATRAELQEDVVGEELMGTEGDKPNTTKNIKFNSSYNGERYSTTARLYKVAAKEFPFDGPMRPYPNWTLGVG